jgi:hypothetical protein
MFDLLGHAPELFMFGADYCAERIPGRLRGSWLVWDKRLVSSMTSHNGEAVGIVRKLKLSHRPRLSPGGGKWAAFGEIVGHEWIEESETWGRDRYAVQ